LLAAREPGLNGPVPAELKARLAALFLQFLEQIHGGPAGAWLELTLTMPQLKLLFALDWLGPVSMSEAASRLQIGVSATTGLVDRLVEQGLAQRETDPRDRRVVRVACTPAGRTLLGRLRSAGSERLDELLDRIDSADLEHCARALAAINAAAARTTSQQAELESTSRPTALRSERTAKEGR
jgi:DNA-binding MarR family transcriptional regulator